MIEVVTQIYLLLNKGIDITCLKILSEERMKNLVPKIDHRAKHKANINKWKKKIFSEIIQF